MHEVVHRLRTFFPIAIKKRQIEKQHLEIKITLTLSEALWVTVVVSV